jgi:hypothetical protein
MHKTAIGAHRQELYSQSFELIVTGSDRCQLRWSDKGEVPWIEAEDNPFPFVC